MTDLKTLAKYPFLNEARDYVASLNLTLNEIQKHPIYSASVDMGRQRVLDALNGKLNIDITDKISQELSILSYAVARILVNLTGNRTISNRYSAIEAKQAYEFLRNEDEEMLRKIRDDVDFKTENNKIKFQDYLMLSRNLVRQDSKWKLVNRGVNSGYVDLNESEIPILLREAIKLRIMKPMKLTGIPEEFKNTARWLNSTVITQRGIEIKQLNNKALPPCISSMLTSLETGDISHNGMFILGTFFINLGLRVDDVIKIFSKFPKFNEEKTRYQLEFLAGERGGTRYTCPTCAKIKSYGLCVRDCGVKHPLQYYRERVRGTYRGK